MSVDSAAGMADPNPSGDLGRRTELKLVSRFHIRRNDIVSPWLCYDDDSFLNIDVHPHKPWIIFVAQKRSIQVWDYRSGTLVTSWDIDERLGLWVAVKFVARSETLFIALRNDKNSVMMRKVDDNFSWDLIRHIGQAHKSPVRDVAPHPSLSYLMTFSDIRIKLWNWSDSWASMSYKVMSVTAVAFHPSETTERGMFASASRDEKIRLWKIDSGRSPMHTFEALPGHEIGALQFCSDPGRSLLIGGTCSGRVCIWNYKERARVAVSNELGANVCSVFFHPRLPYIFAATTAGAVAAWKDSEVNYSAPSLEHAMLFTSGLTELGSMAPCGTSDKLVVGGKAEFVVFNLEEEVIADGFSPATTSRASTPRNAPEASSVTGQPTHTNHVSSPSLMDSNEIPHWVMTPASAVIQQVTADQLLDIAQKKEEVAETLLKDSIQLRTSAMTAQADVIDALQSQVRAMREELERSRECSRMREELLECSQSSARQKPDHSAVGEVQVCSLRKLEMEKLNAGGQDELSTTDNLRAVVDKLRALDHPHLVRLLGVCYEENSLVYEKMANGSVDCMLSAQQSLPWYERLRVMNEVAEALSFLHTNGIVHCGIKPSNISLNGDFVAKLGAVDRALAVQYVAELSGAVRQAKTTVVVAKDDMSNFLNFLEMDGDYLAPECEKAGAFTMKTDIYAFGITLLEMLTGTIGGAKEKIGDTLDDPAAFPKTLDEKAGAWDASLAWKIAKIGMKCASHEKVNRPLLIEGLDNIRPGLQEITSQAIHLAHQ